MTKKILFALFSLLISSTVISQTNLLTNGGLETWSGTPETPENWSVVDAPNFSRVTDANEGNFAINIPLTERSGPFRATLETIGANNIQLPANTTYTFSIDYKVSAGIVQGITAFILRDGNIQVDTGFENPIEDGAWHTLTFDFITTQATEHSIDIDLTATGAGAEIILDNVRLEGQVPNLDREALIAIYNATDGDNWNISWDLNADISTWAGVILDSNGRVTNLSLRNNNLIGSIPTEIGDLTELTLLNLSNNNLTNNVPAQIGQLSKLRVLYLNNNNLTGAIPDEIGALSQLELMELFSNNFNGAIPPEIGQLTKLEVLLLSRNELTGTIPSELSQLSLLRRLGLGINNLFGEIPNVFQNFQSLTDLGLSENNLEGIVPASLIELPNLRNIGLANNNFVGQLPVFSNSSDSILSLNLSGNNFNGEIPVEYSLMANCVELYINTTTQLSSIPQELSSLTQLRVLSIIVNISGSITPSPATELPLFLANLNQLTRLQLISIGFTGPIPQEITQLPALEVFDLQNNYLTGDVPLFTSPNIRNILLNRNDFVFENLEALNNSGINTLFFNRRQTDIPVTRDITVLENESFSLNPNTSSPTNVYDWTRLASGTVSDAALFTVNSATSADAGVYRCSITNTQFPGAIMQTEEFVVRVNPSDDDNDGVGNNLDLCPDTPNGESVDGNGCSQSQLDDDNDGIPNNEDQCPNTPSGETVDAVGCSASDVMDADNDGVPNSQDQCPNTPLGESTNASGCSISQLVDVLPQDIRVKVLSTTCPDVENGTIEVGFEKNEAFVITVVGPNFFERRENVDTSVPLVFENLGIGLYDINVAIDGISEFGLDYQVMVTEPENLAANKSVIDYDKQVARVVVSGSRHYKAIINSREREFSFETDGLNTLEIPISKGVNTIVVATDKACQGQHQETLLFNQTRILPNPVTDFVEVHELGENGEVSITISDLSGAVVYQEKRTVENRFLEQDISFLPSGTYLLSIQSKKQAFQSKIIKK